MCKGVGGACVGGARCSGRQCYTALSVRNGTSLLQKGCAGGSHGEPGGPCRAPPQPDLTVACCQGHLCNANVTMETAVRGEPRFCFIVHQAP